MSVDYPSMRTRLDGVLFATLDIGPLNLLGVDLVRDLVSLVDALYTDPGDVRVIVLESASPHYFSAHVDLTAVPQYTAEAASLARHVPVQAGAGGVQHLTRRLGRTRAVEACAV